MSETGAGFVATIKGNGKERTLGRFSFFRAETREEVEEMMDGPGIRVERLTGVKSFTFKGIAPEGWEAGARFEMPCIPFAGEVLGIYHDRNGITVRVEQEGGARLGGER